MVEQLEKGSRILLISDITNQPPKTFFWKKRDPLSSGVNNLANQLEAGLKDDYKLLHLNMDSHDQDGPMFPVRVPTLYPPVEIAIYNWTRLWQTMKDFHPDAIFNLTPEGSIGRVAKWLCHRPGMWNSQDGQKIPYSVAYTTNWDQYWSQWINDDTRGIINKPPESFQPFYSLVFKGADTVLVPTPKYQEKLARMGIDNAVVWPRGVDTELFRPTQEGDCNPYEEYDWYRDNQLPIYIYFGRISTVKNIEDFLSLHTPDAHKIVIGDGPHKKRLERHFKNDPRIHFLGPLYGKKLANHIRHADLSFFPSMTDTFGQTIIQAQACGVPVIAYDVPGPGEIVIAKKTGMLADVGAPLSEVISDALKINRESCAQIAAERYPWSETTRILLENLHQIHWK